MTRGMGTLLRCGIFAAALAFVSISYQWESEQILPWSLRGTGIAIVLLMTIVLGGWRSMPAAQKMSASIERHVWAVVGVMAATAFGIAAGLAFLVLGPFPHVPDGFSYFFQAKIFAGGELFASAPPLPRFFEYEWMTVADGRWFSIFPPGWPALLAVGVKAGVPALVNPLLASACVVVVYALGAALFDVRRGLLCALLCCFSPFFLFMSSEFMSHTATLLFTALSTLSHVKATARRRRSIALFGLAGAFAGIAFLIRPIDALVVWASQTMHGLWLDRSRRMATGCVTSAVALAIGVGLYLIYNRLLVGTWFMTPLTLVEPQNRMGFGADIGAPWTPFPTMGHNVWRAVLNLNHNAAVMSQDLFGWPISSLLFVLLVGAFGIKDQRHGLSFSVTGAMVVGYALYRYHGVAFGARFYFALLPHLVLLSIEGIRQAPAIVSRAVPRLPGAARLADLSVIAVGLCFVFGWTVYVPKVAFVAPYRDQRDINAGFYAYQQSRLASDPAIVFVRVPRVFFYGQALLANELPVRSARVVYALDRGDANRELTAMFPSRRVDRYVYNRMRRAPPTWLPSFIREAGPSK